LTPSWWSRTAEVSMHIAFIASQPSRPLRQLTFYFVKLSNSMASSQPLFLIVGVMNLPIRANIALGMTVMNNCTSGCTFPYWHARSSPPAWALQNPHLTY
jgi:hypothetical protein